MYAALPLASAPLYEQVELFLDLQPNQEPRYGDILRPVAVPTQAS